MFNAIFGNFLFSRAAAQPEAQPEQSAVEASTQTALTASISTQTTCNNEQANCSLMAASTTGLMGKSKAEDWVIVDPTLEQQDSTATKVQRNQGPTEDKGCQGENLVEMQEAGTQQQQPMMESVTTVSATAQSDAVVVEEEDEDDDDVMLGSFFERHACDSEVKTAKTEETDEEEEDIAEEFEEKNPVKEVEEPTITKEEETWLITPLPCLTSITSSQRSIVENGTLENLLIEHPSMSIFMSATQSVSSSIRSDEDEAIYEADYQAHRKLEQKQKQKLAGKKEEFRQQIQAKKAALASPQPKPITQLECTQFGTRTFASVLKEKTVQPQPQAKPQVQEPVKPAKVEVVIAAKPVEAPKCVIVKSVAEKRKESDKSEVANLSAGSSSESLSAASTGSVSSSKAKKEKKNKKSTSSPANKENLQVRTLLFSDLKKANASGRGLESILTNKNQMKRNNKNALFSKTNVSSKKQRKYHNLQQPSFGSYSSNQQF